MRLPRLASGLAVVLIACSPDAGDESPAASEELKAAAEATLALDSFHVEAGLDDSAPMDADYNTPDRARRFGPGPLDLGGSRGTDHLVTISIGDSGWASADRPGYFWKLEGGDVSDILFPLTVLRTATDVSRRDGNFSFMVDRRDGTRIEAEAVVHNGFITSVFLFDHDTVEGRPLPFTYHFSQFDSAPRVEAPPANKVIGLPDLPECPDEYDEATPGSLLICADTGSAEP